MIPEQLPAETSVATGVHVLSKPPSDNRNYISRYKTLHVWMLLPMLLMQAGIYRDYWGDFTENAWSVHVHYWTGTVWYAFLIIQPYWATHGQLPRHRTNIESVGGKLHGFWYAFGAHDGYCLWEAPDNVAMAAVGFAITGGGALSKFETTPLLTVEETLEALRRAQKIGYRPPGSR